MKDVIWNTVKAILTHQSVQIVVVISGLIVAALGFLIESKLGPVASSLINLQGQVSAQGIRLNSDEKYIPQFIQTQQQVIDLGPRLDRIESKVDSIDNFLRGYK